MHDDKVIKVFISHKSEDHKLAKGIRELIVRHSSDVEVFISEKGICAGKDWDEKIRDALRKTDLLILLYTDPSKRWEWPLFEAGLYTPLQDGNKSGPIVCLYAGEDPPPPLHGVQGVRVIPQMLPGDPKESERKLAVEANLPLVDLFLRPLFVTGELVGRKANADLDDRFLEEMALQIARLFAPSASVESSYVSARFAFEYPHQTPVESNRIPEEVAVRALDGSLDLFGMTSGTTTWGDLADNLAQDKLETEWAETLATQMSGAMRNKEPGPIEATFRDKAGRIYKPVLYRVDRTSDGRNSFVVLFSEQPAPAFYGGPGNTGMVFNVLWLTNRFRDEVLEPCIAALGPDADDRDCARTCSQLKQRIRLIEKEGARIHLRDPDRLFAAFEIRDDIKEIQEMVVRWEAFKEELYKTEGIRDRAALRRTLQEMLKINRRFRLLAARRYYALVKEDDARVQAAEPVGVGG